MPVAAVSPAQSSSISIMPDAAGIRRCVVEVLQRETGSTIDPEELPAAFGRVPIEITFRVLPVAFDGRKIQWDAAHSETVLALTRDVSCDGMAFEHGVEFEDRHFVAFFPPLSEKKLALVFERLWSQELRPLETLSGGRFIGVANIHEPRVSGK